MKKTIAILAIGAVLWSCNETKDKTNSTAEAVVETVEETTNSKLAYQSFGEQIDDKGVLSKDEMLEAYKSMKEGDTVTTKFKATVKKVCQNKGCWMRLDMGEMESFVKFKDYGFFMPMDIAGQEVIVEGKAFIATTSVEELKHFAEDGGKTKEEIDAITEPEVSYSFTSSGVLIPAPETN